MFKSKKLQPLANIALGSALVITGLFSNANAAHAAEMTADQKAAFETVYFDSTVTNRAGRMLLEEFPNLVSDSKSNLDKLIKDSDALLKEAKPIADGLYPERAKEAQNIKDLDKTIFDSKVTQESVYLLFELTPKKIEPKKDKFVGMLNDSLKLTDEGEYTLNQARGIKTLSIVHVNDTHGRVVENAKDKEIGFAKLKTFYDYKNVNNNAMLLNAGDVVHGTTFATISEGESVIDIMNQMGFDAMTAGNHDFNYGYQKLMNLNARAKFPIMGSNVVNQANEPILNTGQIYTVDGVKVGVFGLATEETRTKSSPANTEGLTFISAIDTANREVANLRNQGAEFIICLSHLGLDVGSRETSDLIARSVPGIDLIVDGHSHTKLETGKLEGNTLIAQAEAHGYNIGEVTVKLDKDNKVISKQARLHPYARMQYLKANPAILSQIETVQAQNDTILKVKVGETLVTLDGKREDVRTRETNLGSFIADAMIEATGADIALTNGGGIRDQIAVGEITKGDVLTVFPFTNFLVTIDVTGADIKAALEHGLTDAPNPAGKFPQIAGMTVKYDQSKPAGSRVTEVLVNGAPLDMNKTYSLATNDFLAIGGDGYEMFKGKTRTSERGLISDIFEEAIKKEGTISPGTYNRIEDISEAGLVNRAA